MQRANRQMRAVLEVSNCAPSLIGGMWREQEPRIAAHPVCAEGRQESPLAGLSVRHFRN
jgi:hypothetical protein